MYSLVHLHNMMMKLKFLLILTLLSFSTVLFAQRKVEQIDPEKQAEETADKERLEKERSGSPKWRDNVSFGGNLGGGIGNGSSFFMVQPMAFYRFTDRTMAGAGISYYYWSLTYYNSVGAKSTLSDNAYGFNIFGRQQLFDPVFVHVELMPLNFKVYDQKSNEIRREWVPSLYLGGGIRQTTSDRSGFYFVVLYDVLYNEGKSFRGSPIDLRTGFYF
jgi:hypothetical protein